MITAKFVQDVIDRMYRIEAAHADGRHSRQLTSGLIALQNIRDEIRRKEAN